MKMKKRCALCLQEHDILEMYELLLTQGRTTAALLQLKQDLINEMRYLVYFE